MRVPRDSHDDDPTADSGATTRDDVIDARHDSAQDAAGQDAAGQDAAGVASATDAGAGDGASGGDGGSGGDGAFGREPISEEVAVESEHQVKVRRTPRYGRFMILGGAVFAVASFIVTYSLPQGSGYDRNTVFGFTLLIAVAVGVGLGALAAIIAAAATKHTERTVVADRIDVRRVDVTRPGDELPDLGELPSEADGVEPGDTRRPE